MAFLELSVLSRSARRPWFKLSSRLPASAQNVQTHKTTFPRHPATLHTPLSGSGAISPAGEEVLGRASLHDEPIVIYGPSVVRCSAIHIRRVRDVPKGSHGGPHYPIIMYFLTLSPTAVCSIDANKVKTRHHAHNNSPRDPVSLGPSRQHAFQVGRQTEAAASGWQNCFDAKEMRRQSPSRRGQSPKPSCFEPSQLRPDATTGTSPPLSVK